MNLCAQSWSMASFTYQIALTTPGQDDNIHCLRWYGSLSACRLLLHWWTADLQVWTATSPTHGCIFHHRGWSACVRWPVLMPDEAAPTSPNDLPVTRDTRVNISIHLVITNEAIQCDSAVLAPTFLISTLASFNANNALVSAFVVHFLN